MKFLKEWNEWGGDFNIYDKTLSGVFYHGSYIESLSDIFYKPEIGYSDWDAIWLTYEENIASNFSDWGAGGYRILFEIELEDCNIAVLNYEETQELMEYLNIMDFRESISYLKDEGFDGWEVPGAIGSRLYDDVAIFNDDLIKVLRMKFFDGVEWGDYMTADEMKNYINDILG